MGQWYFVCKLTEFVQGESSSRRRRVLLVDDSPDVVEALSRLFRTHYDVATATSPEEALATMESNPVDVVITDYDMPTHSGLWLLQEIERRDPRVVRILSSGGFPPELSKHLASGLVQHFLPKPSMPSQVRRVLASGTWPPVRKRGD